MQVTVTYISWYSDFALYLEDYLGRVKQIWYLSPMRTAKVQACLCIPAVSPEPPLLAHTSSESRGTFRQKARSLAPLNGWACAVTICHDGMVKDTNSLYAAHLMYEHQSYSRIMSQLVTFVLKINVGHCDLHFMVQ